MINELEIVRSACNRIGLPAPEDLTSEVNSGITAKRAYNQEARAALALHPWSFAQEIVQLARLEKAPIAGFQYRYQLPVEDLVIATDQLTDTPADETSNYTDFRKIGQEIHTNTDQLYAVVRKQVGPHLWNPLFAQAVIVGLAGVLIESVASDGRRADSLIREAYGSPQEERRGGLIRAAINADGYTTPNRRLRMGNNPLTNAWHS